MPPKKSRSGRGATHWMPGSTPLPPGRAGPVPDQPEASSSSAQYDNYGRPVAGASTQQAAMAEVQDAARDIGDGLVVGETFADYIPAKLKIGMKHPDHVVETTSMRSIPPPDVRYNICLPKTVIDQGLLSALQLEAITYACQQHETLNHGERAGFLIGDGAGVGKGRTIAGIIYENWLRGRRKSIWFSVSPDLKVDAERDLGDIGADFIKVHRLVNYQKITYERGVIFSTFSGLIGRTSATKKGCFKTRLDQMIDWCGRDFEGCIIFDECHRAKNLFPDAKKKLASTKTGLAVKAIQDRLPLARIVYASATGATEPRNMGYMTRLGLWGELTPFEDFYAFMKAIENRGVGAMEIVAMEMKHRGMYIARQLSFNGVTFRIEEVKLDPAFVQVYDESVKFWILAEQKFREAGLMAGLGKKKRFVLVLQFWGCHQRFFKYMCLNAKIDAAVKYALDAVEDGKCAVIGLQSTGEAKTNQMREAIEENGGELNEFISTSRAVVMSLFNMFPVELDEDGKGPTRFKFGNDDDDDDGDLDEGELEDLIGEHGDELEENGLDRNLARANKPDIEKRLEKMKLDLIKEFEKFADRLPCNMLDSLIQKLGGPNKVAEMTGRKGRMVMNDNGKISYEKREGKDDADSLNIAEKDRFMDGKKFIAVISEAASSGISLQADRRVTNQRRRVHITLELAWSADRAIQQFGRTHRSNQTSAPEYIFLISDVAGEKRFASVVAHRLERLGALTHGDRRATESRDLSMFNVDTKYGRQALSKMMCTVVKGWISPTLDVPAPPDFPGDFLAAVREALNSVGVLEHNPDTDSYKIGGKSGQGVKLDKFMNRILGVPIRIQNAIFQYFADTLDRVIDMAKKDGKFDLGTMELGKPGSFARLEKRMYYTQKDKERSRTYVYNVICDRGVSFEQAQAILNEQGDENSGFYTSTPMQGMINSHIFLAVPSARTLSFSKDYKAYDIYRPNSGRNRDTQTYYELRQKRESRIRDENKARTHWTRFYDATEDRCYHYFLYGKCSRNYECSEGTRAMRNQILSGSVLGIWRELESVFDGTSAYHIRTMQIVRVIFNNSRRIIGIQLPPRGSEAVLAAISETCGAPKDDTPAALIEMAIEDDNSMIPYRPSGQPMSATPTKAPLPKASRAARRDPNAPSTSRARSRSASSVSSDLSSSDTDDEIDKRIKRPIKREQSQQVKKEEPLSPEIKPPIRNVGPEVKPPVRNIKAEVEVVKKPVIHRMPQDDDIIILSSDDEPISIKSPPRKKKSPEHTLVTDDDSIVVPKSRAVRKVVSLDSSDEDEPEKKPAPVIRPTSPVREEEMPASVRNALTPLRLKAKQTAPTFPKTTYGGKPKVISLSSSDEEEDNPAQRKAAAKQLYTDQTSSGGSSGYSVKENVLDLTPENLNTSDDMSVDEPKIATPKKSVADADAEFITRGMKRMLSG